MKILITGINKLYDKIIIPGITKKSDDIDIIISSQFDKELDLGDNINFIELDLDNIPELLKHLNANRYDIIFHNDYMKYEGKNCHLKKKMFHYNVDSTEQFIINCLKHNSRLIYISTLEVYGNDPKKLPISNRTELSASNYYESTRIRAEKLVDNFVLRGLNAQIIRHSYLYGRNYPGIFKYLIDLKSHHLLYTKKQEIKRNLTNIDSYLIALKKIIDSDFKSGKIINIIDPKPIIISDVIHMIYEIIDSEEPPSYVFNQNFLLEVWKRFSLLFNRYNLIHNLDFLIRNKYLDEDFIWEEVRSKQIDTMGQIKILLQNYLKEEGKK